MEEAKAGLDKMESDARAVEYYLELVEALNLRTVNFVLNGEASLPLLCRLKRELCFPF